MQLEKNLPGRVAPRAGQINELTALRLARSCGFFKSAFAVPRNGDGDKHGCFPFAC